MPDIQKAKCFEITVKILPSPQFLNSGFQKGNLEAYFNNTLKFRTLHIIMKK